MGRRLTLQEIKQRLFEIHGNQVSLDESTYINTSLTARFIDIDFGPWRAKANHIIGRKQSHPLRRGNKIKQTTLKKYGPTHYIEFSKKGHEKTDLSIEEIKKRLEKLHGNILILDEETYINTHAIARFVDKEFGEWWTKPNTVLEQLSIHPVRAKKLQKENWEKLKKEHPEEINKIVDRREKTFLEKYGVKHALLSTEIYEQFKETMNEKYGANHPSQVSDLRLKAARSANKITILEHWSSREQVSCQGSYEVAVVKYLNKNKINYIFQPQTFKMPSGKTYTPDLYLSERDLWVEIKGYFRKDAREKWNWFHSEHPNSELWNQQKLKELGIL